MFSRLIEASQRALPAQCDICHAWPARPLCTVCVGQFLNPRRRCRRCALPVPQGQEECGECVLVTPVLDSCVAAFSYEYPWSGCIARFKYDGQAALAGPLAQLLACAPGAPAALQACDLVLPMPLSDKRLAQRGFNQAHELAKHLAPGKTRADLLLRIRDTAPQHQLSKAERRRNVLGAFMAAPEALPALHGKKLMLVDDVMTSGASINAAAGALKEAGAAAVYGLVLARTDTP